MFVPMPGRPPARSVYRLGPRRSSLTISSDHRSPTSESAWAMGQYWS